MTRNIETLTSGKGIVFEIERYAIHDGPGIRTVVFMKGCPLCCTWCSNPESQTLQPQLIHWLHKCLGCGACIENCPENALSCKDGKIIIDRKKCTLCGKCTLVCNCQAIYLTGSRMSASDVLQEILKDEQFYRNSGGGATFSGGEPLAQMDFLVSLATLCKENYIHTCLETCGYVPWVKFERVIPFIDLFLYDFKQMDPAKHKGYTGVSNELIHENFKRLIALKKEVIARVPVIPGLNHDNENLQQLAAFLKKYAPDITIDLLPYHRLGKTKYKWLDKAYKLADLEPPSPETMEHIKGFFLSSGFETTIGG